MHQVTKYNLQKFLLKILLIAVFIGISGCSDFVVLQSKGEIGEKEATLITIAAILMLIVIIPVFVLVFWFSVKYKASNKKAKYLPNWSGSKGIEWVIWMVPVGIIIILSYLTWTKTVELDPYKPINNNREPIEVEVISFDWKWLFIYPQYHIATINQLVFPETVPLDFRLTSASVMTSFFIPQLGSQMYAMAGMQTRLHLVANDTGTFIGQNQEFSGRGYETMFFEAKSVSEIEFNNWIEKVRKSGVNLDSSAIEELQKPSFDNSVKYYSNITPGVFNSMIKKFMMGTGTSVTNMELNNNQNKGLNKNSN